MSESVNQYVARAGGSSQWGPYDYDFINVVENLYKPQTVKVRNTQVYRYFFHYYLEEIFNLFEFRGFPEDWDINYFKAVLYCTGKVAVVYADPYKWIPQFCHFGPGRNVYGFPTSIMISNPYFHPADQKTEYDISKDNALIRINPLCIGIADIAAFYAYKKACIAPVVENSALISRNGWILAATGKAEAATMQQAVQSILSGDIVATIREKDFATASHEISFTPFETDAEKHYLVTEALQDMRTVDDMFHNALGMGTINRNKKERTITTEQQTETDACRGNVELWKDCLNEGFRILADRSGGEIDITAAEKYRGDQDAGEGADSVDNTAQQSDNFRRVLSSVGSGQRKVS